MWSGVRSAPAESSGTSELLSHEIKAQFMSSKENCVPPPKGQLTALQINQTAKLFSSSILRSLSLASDWTVDDESWHCFSLQAAFNDSLHPFHDLKPHQNYTSEQWNKKLNWYIKWELKQQSKKNGLNPFLHIFPVQVLKYTSSRFGSGISFLCNRREQSDLFTQPPPLSAHSWGDRCEKCISKNPQSSLSLGPDVLAKYPQPRHGDSSLSCQFPNPVEMLLLTQQNKVRLNTAAGYSAPQDGCVSGTKLFY